MQVLLRHITLCSEVKFKPAESNNHGLNKTSPFGVVVKRHHYWPGRSGVR